MPDDSTTVAPEKPWASELKALIGGSDFNGLHPEGQLKAIDGVMTKYPVWGSQSAAQRHSFAQKALTKYGSAGPESNKATSYSKQTPEAQNQMLESSIKRNLPELNKKIMPFVAGSVDMGGGGNAAEALGAKSILSPLTEPIAKKVDEYAGKALDWVTKRGEIKAGAQAVEKQTEKVIDTSDIVRARQGKKLERKLDTVITDADKKKFIDAARDRLVRNTTGVSYKDTVARRAKVLEQNDEGVYVAGQQHLDHVAAVKNSARDPISLEQSYYGSKYEEATKDHLTEQPDPKAVMEYLDQAKSSGSQFDLGPAAGLQAKARKMFFPKEGEAETAGGMSAAEINSLFDKVDVPNKSPGAYNIPAIKNLETGEIHANPQGHGMAYEDFSKQVKGLKKTTDWKSIQEMQKGGQRLQGAFLKEDGTVIPYSTATKSSLKSHQLSYESGAAGYIPEHTDKIITNKGTFDIGRPDPKGPIKITGEAEPKFEEGFVRDGKYLTKEEALKTTDKIAGPKSKAKAEPKFPDAPTVADIKKLRSEASNMAYNVEPHTPPHHYSLGLVKALDDQLANHGIKGLKELGPAYSDFRHATDPILHGLNKEGQDITLNAAAIFNPKNPQGALHVIQNASDDQLVTLRQSFGDLYNATNGNILHSVNAEAMGKLWPGTPLADSEHWGYFDNAVEAFPQVLQHDPVMAKEVQQLYTEKATPILENAAQEYVDKIVQEVGKLPDGETKANAILKSSQDVKVQAATAYQMVTGMNPKQAAIEAIQNGVIKADPSKIGLGASFDSVKNRGLFYVAAVAMNASSPFMHVMASAAGAIGARAMVGGIIKQGLKDPANAAKLYESIMNPQTPKAMEWLAETAARGVMANFVSKAQSQLKPESEPKTKSVPKTKAENVSLNAVGSTKLADLSKAPIQAAMEAYNKAKNEDLDPDTAKTLRSIITAKAKDTGLAQLDPKARLQLAEMLKEEPHLKDSEMERSEARGLGA